jgi:PAS domain S-box-containing protein
VNLAGKRIGSQSGGLIVLLLAHLLVVVIAVFSYQGWRSFNRHAEQLKRTQHIVSQTNALLSGLKDAETGQRGFLLTAKDSYLEPYRAALRTTPTILSELQNSTKNNPDQIKRIQELKLHIDAKLDELAQTIRLRRTEGLEPALAVVRSDRGSIEMGRIREICAEIEATEANTAAAYADRAALSSEETVISAVGGSGILLAFLVLATATIHRSMARRQQLIHELTLSERSANESRDWLQTTLRSIGDGVIATDGSGRVTLMNPVAQALTGWREEEAQGRLMSDVFSIHNEESGLAVENPITRAIREGRIVGLANHTVLTSKDGKSTTIDDSAAPICDAGGAVRGVVLVFRDVSERKAAEAAVKQASDRLRLLLEANPIGVCASDLRGRIYEANDAFLKITGYSREELSAGAVNWMSITPSQFLDRDNTAVAEARLNGRCAPYEKEYLRKDGSRVPVYTGLVMMPKPREEWIVFVLDLSDLKRAEEKLNEQLLLTKTITDNTPAGLFTTDREHRCIFMNPAAEKLTGYSLSEVARRPLREILRFGPSNGEKRGTDAIENGFGDVGAIRSESVFIRKDGTTFPARYIASPLREGAEIIGAVVEVQDIAAEKKVEETLRQSETHFRNLAESMPQVVWTTTPDGVYDYINARWTESTGCTLEDTKQGLFRKYMYPEDVEALDKAVAEGLRSKAKYSVECRFRTNSDGTLRWHLVRAVPIFNVDGNVQRWFGTSTDIHDQKAVEEECRFRLEELEAFLDATPAFVWITRDAECRLITGNRAANEMLGVESGANVSESAEDKILPFTQWKPDGTEYRAAELPLQRAVASRQPIKNAEIEFRFRDGRRVHTLGNATPLFDSSGRVRGGVAAFLDITERRLAQQALVRANEDLRYFAFAASHDLQEPLRMISSYSQLLVRGYRGQLDQEAAIAVEFITEGVGRMRALLNDLLAYTEVSEDVDRPTDAIDLNLVVQKSLVNLRAATEESGAVITSDPLPRIRGHEGDFLQLFQNLIGNSIKYRGNRPPIIRVCAAPWYGGWRVSISDNGIGIDQEYHSAIFGVFKRLHGSAVPGTGIGLAICQRIVERYGGHIWVESKAGEGATFYFTLPFGSGDPA